MPKISIIVPVYNAEKAVGRCIESILNETWRDSEVLLVDDGSKDRSSEILDEYAAKDARVRVIHQQNAGVSAARNRALSEARGEYIRFLDADDWLSEDSSRLLIRSIEEDRSDLVVADFYRVVGDRVAQRGSIDVNGVLSRREYAEYMMASPADYYYGVLWNKLYKREIIEKYQLRCNEELSFCEDFCFNLEYILHCEKISTLTVPVYYYVKTDGSLVSQNLNPARLVRMKTEIFRYYDQFYREVLDEESYRAQRPEIASFLIAAAGDELVLPLVPGTRKLGEEGVSILNDTGDDPVLFPYYLRKHFARLFNDCALRFHLDLKDVEIFRLLCYREKATLKELADFSSTPSVLLLPSLEKMALRRYVEIRYLGEEVEVRAGKESEALCKEVQKAGEQGWEDLLQELSADEKKELYRLLGKVNTILKRERRGNESTL